MQSASRTEDRLSSLVFTTDQFRPHERLDAWNAAFGSLNEIAVTADDGKAARVRTENWLLGGGIVVSETKVEGARFMRDRVRALRDQFDHWTLRVIRRGQGGLCHSQFDTRTVPGDVVLFSASDIWVCEWDDVEWVTLCIPRDFDPVLTVRLAQLRPGLLNGAGVGLLADLMLALPGRIAHAPSTEIPNVTGIVLAALAAGLPGGTGSEQDAGGALARERARRVVLNHIGSPSLDPAFLARAIGVSRAALYRLFEPSGGVSRFIRHMRLSLAHAALQSAASRGKSIARIAEEHGFPDPPEFSRAFRAAFGRTPREVRAGALTGGACRGLRAPDRAPQAEEADLASRIYRPVRFGPDGRPDRQP